MLIKNYFAFHCLQKKDVKIPPPPLKNQYPKAIVIDFKQLEKQ